MSTNTEVTTKKPQVNRGAVVAVISGSHKGKQGKVLEVNRIKQRAIVEGVAMIKKHERKSQANPQGKIVEREGSIHISNLKVVTPAPAFERKKAS